MKTRATTGQPMLACPVCGREVWLTRTRGKDGAYRIRVHARTKGGMAWCPAGGLTEREAMVPRIEVAW